ncbi:hypothetical protein HK405_005562 [Cladochytrium tenue]|nr:hypothetical protein HK405_005562 [Cladochytrium tenue]
MASTIYLVTGANRGIGRALTASLLQRPSTTVVAAVRDLKASTTVSLADLPTNPTSRLVVVKLDAADEGDPRRAVDHLRADHGLTRLDVVIANAGIGKAYAIAADVSLADVREHFQVNTLGPLALFQATLPLLRQSANPIFVAVTSGMGSTGNMDEIAGMPAVAYSVSKAALNHVVRKIHFENPDLIAFSICPGWTRTEMGQSGADIAGLTEPPVPLEVSISGLLNKIDTATREQTSGTFQEYGDRKYSW